MLLINYYNNLYHSHNNVIVYFLIFLTVHFIHIFDCENTWNLQYYLLEKNIYYK